MGPNGPFRLQQQLEPQPHYLTTLHLLHPLLLLLLVPAFQALPLKLTTLPVPWGSPPCSRSSSPEWQPTTYIAPSTPSSPDTFVSAHSNPSPQLPTAIQSPQAAAPPAPAAPPACRHRRLVVGASRSQAAAPIRRQSTRLAAKDKGKYVDMTDKAVKMKALQNALSSCSPALQHHVKRRGLLNRNKLAIGFPDLRKMVCSAGLGCSDAAAMDAVPPTPMLVVCPSVTLVGLWALVSVAVFRSGCRFSSPLCCLCFFVFFPLSPQVLVWASLC